MTDYRYVMGLLVQGLAYRQIEAMAGCSHRAIARARRVLDDEQLSTAEQVAGLSAEDLDRLFADGRKSVVGEFVPVDIDKVVTARLGRKKPPLKVLWGRYLKSEAAPGARFYGYERFCQIVTEHVRVNDLSLPIAHVPGHTMQVDWAGTAMQVTDPITRAVTPVPVFVATLPFSGMVFAYGYLDEKQPAWCDAHRRAFEYFGGVAQVIVPDNASTASNQISRADRAREVNASYADFLAHYGAAAVPTRSNRPRDKGNAEAGVKVVTNWVIHFLADRVFACLDDLNDAVAAQVEAINDRTPFRGEPRSRRDWFDAHERDELMALPAQRWEPVTWRKAKVHRDWHIQLGTIKYSVPYRFAGLGVDVRIVGTAIEVLADGQIIAVHQQGRHRNGYVTDPEHAPPHYESVAGLWTRGYFLRQGAKVGPATAAALTRLLDGKAIEAQGYRSCMNILDLGKRSSQNRALLEAACRELVAEDPNRPITYTAVKHRISALRAAAGQRPTTTSDDGGGGPITPVPRTGGAVARAGGRDTSRAHLAGAKAFSLDALTTGDRRADDGGDDAAAGVRR
ncbi:IS21 family transposase [Mycobacterium intracellulare]|uniref:IS21 family transposase n=1 Tax=Mycobacterium intracellulare TaxID=1767 RepID=UPI0006CA8DD0|nr:IS21 family transposase [Mycobacterium intracellulare]KPN46009.1 transposase [Mycobacterium intracellulare subsp. chimaera]MCA2312494.1 IS21 family transposase [Mycobacterium intracellulare subsp. chimaera]MCA2354731.1 IS21 family transposase [Mycobacterium intracellulare subsp. chimaera]MEE3755403.1 IS21 family transposase [Mycobacterium intracellulare]